MLLLVLGYMFIAGYQLMLLKREEIEAKERTIALSVTGAAFLLGVLCLITPGWVNPNKAIRFFFEPLQRIMTGS